MNERKPLLVLYIVRHGQTAWNLDGRAQGHSDIPLDEEGFQQALQVGMAFEEVPLGLVITSDLQRARQTAEQIAGSARTSMRSTPDLRERSFGRMEGRPYQEIRAAFQLYETDPDCDPLTTRIGDGESLVDVWYRVERFVNELDELAGHIAVVSHGGTCGVLLAQLLGGTHATARSFRFGNTAISEVHRQPDGHWTLTRYADTAHLELASAPMIDANHTADPKA
ncbi:MAG: histidine phosphatase family protein [Chthonomonas sp.]|nr:histidine phosphatase family protein [Chthonomonas sp.]